MESKFLAEFDEIKFIALGGYGVVAECFGRLDQKLYAVKKITVEYSGLTREEILREAQTLSKMDHPNIVRYYHVWVESSMQGCTGEDMELDEIQSECIYMLMDFCSSSLSKYIETMDKFDAETTSPLLFRDCLRAVEHVHIQEYIHGDISTVNIFLDENKKVKLGDFGLALKIDGAASVQLSNSDGNPKYKAPECKPGAYIDKMVDIYSLGIILAELIHPMETQSERIQVIRKLKDSGPPIEWADHPYTPIIEKALAIEPSDRPTATEMLRMVEDLLENC